MTIFVKYDKNVKEPITKIYQIYEKMQTTLIKNDQNYCQKMSASTIL